MRRGVGWMLMGGSVSGRKPIRDLPILNICLAVYATCLSRSPLLAVLSFRSLPATLDLFIREPGVIQRLSINLHRL